MESKQFSNIMATLAVTYDKKIPPERSKIYFESLKDLDFEICKAAVQNLIMTSEFFPSIAQIRSKYTEISNPSAVTGTVDAMGILNRAISDYGRYRASEALEYIKGESETLYQVVSAIGFGNICNSDLQRYRGEVESLFRDCEKSVKEQAMLSGEVRSKIAMLSGKLRNNALAIEQDDYY